MLQKNVLYHCLLNISLKQFQNIFKNAFNNFLRSCNKMLLKCLRTFIMNKEIYLPDTFKIITTL